MAQNVKERRERKPKGKLNETGWGGVGRVGETREWACEGESTTQSRSVLAGGIPGVGADSE